MKHNVMQLIIICTEDGNSGSAINIVLSTCLIDFLSWVWTLFWVWPGTALRDATHLCQCITVEGTCWDMGAAGGVREQKGGGRKSLVFESTSSKINRWDVNKISKKRVCKSAHNFWSSSRAHRIREHKIPRNRFSGTSFFQLDQIQKCH